MSVPGPQEARMHEAEISFGTWNLNWFTRSRTAHEAKINYLATKEWDLLALQEATPEFLEQIEASGLPEMIVAPKWFSARFTSALVARNGVRAVSALPHRRVPVPGASTVGVRPTRGPAMGCLELARAECRSS